eukprot:12419180-Karenia_brevis.AAC.1
MGDPPDVAKNYLVIDVSGEQHGVADGYDSADGSRGPINYDGSVTMRRGGTHYVRDSSRDVHK